MVQLQPLLLGHLFLFQDQFVYFGSVAGGNGREEINKKDVSVYNKHGGVWFRKGPWMQTSATLIEENHINHKKKKCCREEEHVSVSQRSFQRIYIPELLIYAKL